MERTVNILYLHGMGGGADSRIPRILKEWYASHDCGADVRVVCRTYDFDPEKAASMISAWREELDPALVIGESLGSVHAIRLKEIPHILVAPALNGPVFLYRMAPFMRLWIFRAMAGRKWKVKPGDRQKLVWRRDVLRKYRPHLDEAMRNTPSGGSRDYFFAFFGERDHYRRQGVVSLGLWEERFGKGSYALYDGTHFMEEEYVYSMLIPKISEVLGLGRDLMENE